MFLLLTHSSGAHPNVRSRPLGSTPLHIAVAHGKVELMELLVESSADMTALDCNGCGVFDYAALSSDGLPPVACMEWLLKHGAVLPVDCTQLMATACASGGIYSQGVRLAVPNKHPLSAFSSDPHLPVEIWKEEHSVAARDSGARVHL